MCRLFHSLINISIGKTVAEHYVSHSIVQRFFQGNYLRERSGALHKQAIMSYTAIFNVKKKWTTCGSAILAWENVE